MVGYIIAFAVGSMFGMLGMAGLACSARTKICRENSILGKRIGFLEDEIKHKHYQPVKDPRPHVHSMSN
jgi:hypothetical protein